MIIRSIELNNFRNYESLNIEFDNNINILYGDNAQGKTNLLEACYYTAISRSYKGSKDKGTDEGVGEGEDEDGEDDGDRVEAGGREGEGG